MAERDSDGKPAYDNRRFVLLTRNREPRLQSGGIVFQWGAWVSLDRLEAEQIKPKLKFWRELNDDAVHHRGEKAKREFRVEDTLRPSGIYYKE